MTPVYRRIHYFTPSPNVAEVHGPAASPNLKSWYDSDTNSDTNLHPPSRSQPPLLTARLPNLHLNKLTFLWVWDFFVLHSNEMIQDDAKSIVLWCFASKLVLYHGDTIILKFLKLMPHV
jgi:hypothetical protein